MKKLLTLVGLVAVLALAGCAGADTTTEDTATQEGSAWEESTEEAVEEAVEENAAVDATVEVEAEAEKAQ
jgi:spermidine/putrescine-binding protein